MGGWPLLGASGRQFWLPAGACEGEGVRQLFGLFGHHCWFVLFVGLAVIGSEVFELVIAGVETSKESSFSWSSSNVMEVSRACIARTSSL